MISESSSGKNRHEMQIMVDFITAIEKDAQIKTEIMRRANVMNNDQFERYKTRLIEQGYVKIVGDDKYQATNAGRQIRDMIVDLLNAFKKKEAEA